MNQTDAVAGEHYVKIGGWKCYQQEKKEGMKSWILLDSEYTTDIFGKSKYLTNIKSVATTLKLMTYIVLLTTNQQKYLKNLPSAQLADYF